MQDDPIEFEDLTTEHQPRTTWDRWLTAWACIGGSFAADEHRRSRDLESAN